MYRTNSNLHMQDFLPIICNLFQNSEYMLVYTPMILFSSWTSIFRIICIFFRQSYHYTFDLLQ